jgi:hypothetical protein
MGHDYSIAIMLATIVLILGTVIYANTKREDQ